MQLELDGLDPHLEHGVEDELGRQVLGVGEDNVDAFRGVHLPLFAWRV